ncbi:MAG TPA: M48 family metalloprotease [Candidatus Polarisedimenticolaceae bacterium]|nr:M48 family metalloprotease [Candidatus Polarisedimenticolaceae bacterium]
MRTGLAAGLLASTSLLSDVVASPTKINPAFNILSVAQDVEIGRRSAVVIEKQLPILQDRAAEAHVNAIGRRLAAFFDGERYPYQFKIVNASDSRALPLPGGVLYLDRGLIEAVKSEGQLVGVMAHEMAHIALRHGTHHVSKAYVGQAGLGLLGGLLEKQEGTTEKVMDAVGGFGLNPLLLTFGRTEESQADILGAQIMVRAGYDPQDMIEVFELLQAKPSGDSPASKDRSTRIREEMKLLTIRPADTLGGFRQAKAALIAMPKARSLEEITQDAPRLTVGPRPASDGGDGAVEIDAPSETFRTLEPGKRKFQIDYPSNWQTYESASGSGVTLAPEGGLVDAGGHQRDLIYGVVLNVYAPFGNDGDGSAPVEDLGVGRTALARAMNDLVGQIVRTNSSLKVVENSPRVEQRDGAAALSLVLSGRSVATGDDERVSVHSRELSDGRVVYALFIAPGQDYGQLHGTFTRMMGSLRVNDDATHP